MRVALEAGSWTAACFLLWLTTLSSITWQDAALAGAAAAISAGCAIGGRRLTGGSWRLRAGWLRWLLTLPVAVVIDTVDVLLDAYRLRRGADETKTVRLPAGETGELAAGRSALSSLALSATPASYVFDTVFDADADTRVLQVHSVGTRAPAWARVDPSEL